MRPLPDRHGDQGSAPFDSGRAAGHLATDMPVTDTAQLALDWSGAVSGLSSARPGDVDSTAGRRTRPTTRGTRTSIPATRTGTTRTTSSGLSSSEEASLYPHAAFSFSDLHQAYYDCRRRKRTTESALRFEIHLERNLVDLYEELLSGNYRPGKSICFVIKYPKPREVWAADFRDRIVHHLVYNHIGPRFERTFIADSCACIKGRGTLYAVERAEGHIRSISQNWQVPAWFLKCDLANFFISINKNILWQLLEARIPEPWLRDLTHTLLFHDPRTNYEFRGAPGDIDLVPRHKRLTCQPDTHGLPIGNLPSQLGANILLNELDQHVKQYLRVRHYVRYVDDFILFGRSPQWLEATRFAITLFLPTLDLRLNDSKTVLQPLDRGVDFVGQVIKPWYRRVRRRTVDQACKRVAAAERSQIPAVANSYFGLLRQASRSLHDRARVARAVLRRGRPVNGALTMT